MKYLSTFAVVAAMALSGCAEKSDNIQAAYTSPMIYQNYSCSQLRQEAEMVSRRAAQAAGVQNKQAENDAVATGVALVLFWPAAFFIKGNKGNAAELARLKGQLEAIESENIRRKCGIVFAKPEPKSAKTEAETPETPEA